MNRDLIRWLKESMPGIEIRTAELDSGTTDVLQTVLTQLGPSGDGPIMIVGLEVVSSREWRSDLGP